MMKFIAAMFLAVATATTVFADVKKVLDTPTKKCYQFRDVPYKKVENIRIRLLKKGISSTEKGSVRYGKFSGIVCFQIPHPPK